MLAFSSRSLLFSNVAMGGLNSATIAKKKPAATELLKGKPQQKITKKEKGRKTASKKDSDAPKRPVGAFSIFMEEFRNTFKLKFPGEKSISAVGKAGGEKWKSMSETEKSPYLEKASKRKAEYQIVLQEYKKKQVWDAVTGKKLYAEAPVYSVYPHRKEHISVMAILLVSVLLTDSVESFSSSCADELRRFSPCLSYVYTPPNNNCDVPTSDCCSAFNFAVESGDALCLCLLVKDPHVLGLAVNDTRVLSLSSFCPALFQVP